MSEQDADKIKTVLKIVPEFLKCFRACLEYIKQLAYSKLQQKG